MPQHRLERKIRAADAIIIYLGLLILAGCGRLQKEQQVGRASTAWQDVRCDAEGFAVSMPGIPIRETRGSTLVLALDLPDISYEITFSTSKGPDVDPPLADQLYNESRNRRLKSNGGRLLGEKTLNINGHRARQFAFSLNGPPEGKGIMILLYAGRRNYTLLVLGRNVDESHPDTRRFLDSFLLLPDK
jgi:hypothetical protein